MPTLIRYSCNKCSSHIGTQDAYHSIGEPFLICSECNFVNVISGNRTEWDLKSSDEQLLFQAKVLFFPIILGVGTGILLTVLFERYLNFEFKYFFSIPIGVVVWYLIASADMRRQIRESRERMSDPKYKELLSRLGLRSGA